VAAAIAYYTIPKVTGNPLYSTHRASAFLVRGGVLLDARGPPLDVGAAARVAQVFRLGGRGADPRSGDRIRVQHPFDHGREVAHVRGESRVRFTVTGALLAIP